MQLLLVLLVRIVLGDNVVRINNADEFIGFSKTVNSGVNYSGTTVLLGSDLSLPDILEPIGNYTYHFRGVFDGQGYIINNFKMNSPSVYIGLFGYSKGLTIRNVVLGSSCSIKSSHSGTHSIFMGGIIGYCHANSGECSIENSVNMADVTIGGNTTGNSGFLYHGGVAGYLQTSLSYPSYIKNCVNYGPVTHLGKVSAWSYIGSIVGRLSAPSSSSYIHVYNCLNYGTIAYIGTSSNLLHLGGIVGDSYYACIENCLNAGEISSQNTPSENNIGSIVGYAYSNTNITHCYYTNDVDVNKLYGYITPTSTMAETPNFPSTVNSTLIANLNNYATKNDTWNKWLLNMNNASVSFIINHEEGFTVNSQIILLPDLANNSERNFSGWYTDTNLTTPFNSNQVESNTTLYGMFCGSPNYTVTLDVNGGNELDENEVAVGCMSYYGPFPKDVTRTGYTLTGWFTEKEGGDKVETGDKVKILNNHTLYAHWVINNYTVSFDFDNGTTVNKTFIYNTSVEYPKENDMKREGYTFNGWDKTVINMPAQNITIAALWRANNYTVTFYVNGGNLSETSMTVTFNNPYESLPTPSKEGYFFLGWFTESNVIVKNETRAIITDNHTLYAHWEKVTNHVEVVFNTKDLSREDVEDIVKKYTDAEFTISEFGEGSGEIRVIIKFVDNKEAVKFIRNVNEPSRNDDSNMIKRVGFVPDTDASFTSFLYPALFLFLL